MQYSDEYRKEIIKKMLTPGGLSVPRLSEETGIHEVTLYKWRKDARTGVMSKRKSKSPRSWSLEEKYAAILEAKSKNDKDLGIWLREKGVHSDHLRIWENEVAMALGAINSPEQKKLERDIKELRREVRRKDTALAEVSALLILKKKFEAFMGYQDQPEK